MPISEKTLDFLFDNRMQDSRAWFQAHREQYQRYVLEPMTELTEQLAPAMQAIDPQLVTLAKVGKCISRIYRDTRFSRDKSIYRDVMWCVFMRDKKEYRCPPGFVVEFSPRGFRYGCGYYDIPAANMQALREIILRGDKSFQMARRAYAGQDIFGMEGELYKRSHYPGEPEEKQQWLNRKCIAFMHNSEDFDLLFSEDLWRTLAEGFALLKPVYDFFCEGLIVDTGAV